MEIVPLREFFTKNQKNKFDFKVLKQGVTVRCILNNTENTVFKFISCKYVDGILKGTLYLNRFKNREDVESLISYEFLMFALPQDVDYLPPVKGECVQIGNLTVPDLIKVFEKTNILKGTVDELQRIDNMIYRNRSKLTEGLK